MSEKTAIRTPAFRCVPMVLALAAPPVLLGATPDYSGLVPGDSVAGPGTVHPSLTIDGASDANYLLEGAVPVGYGAPPGTPIANGCLGEGFTDLGAVGSRSPHSYGFTFSLDGFQTSASVSQLSLEMFDFGDYNPSGSADHKVALVGYDSNGAVVDEDVLTFTTSAVGNPPEMAAAGDACDAQPGDPGRRTFTVQGSDIVQVELQVRSGSDPFIAFGNLSFDLESQCPPTLDFATAGNGTPLTPGQIIDDEFAAYGITVTTNDADAHPLMIFDSANPTGNDPDLGTPNSDFGGLGSGDGGKFHRPGRNGLPRGQVLIISEDGNSDNPNDYADGGTINFQFDPPAPLVTEVHILDAEEKGGKVQAFNADDQPILPRPQPILKLGDNSFQAVPVGAGEVSRLEIELPGSGAVSAIVFCDDCGADFADGGAGEPSE